MIYISPRNKNPAKETAEFMVRHGFEAGPDYPRHLCENSSTCNSRRISTLHTSDAPVKSTLCADQWNPSAERK